MCVTNITVGEKCILSHKIETYIKSINLSEIIIMGYYDSVIFTNLLTEYQRVYQIPICYLQETRGCGTAGGLRIFKNRILHNNPDLIVLLHGDISSDYPLKDMISFHNSKGGDVTLLGVKYSPLLHPNDTSL